MRRSGSGSFGRTLQRVATRMSVCLWGDQPGLEPMPLASGVPFMIKAITNSTYGHHGERVDYDHCARAYLTSDLHRVTGEMAFPEVTLVPCSGAGSGSRAGCSKKRAPM